MSSSELTRKSCEPCRGGIDPMTAEEAKSYLAQVPGWELSTDARRIKRGFSFDTFKDVIDFVNQVGGNQLWRNAGGGRFQDVTGTVTQPVQDATGVQLP